jgi:hypothetical protein
MNNIADIINKNLTISNQPIRVALVSFHKEILELRRTLNFSNLKQQLPTEEQYNNLVLNN